VPRCICSRAPPRIAFEARLADKRPVTGLVVAIFALTYLLVAFRRLRLLPIGRCTPRATP
jgi:hypothetical protein